jgi:hypothetical protein
MKWVIRGVALVLLAALGFWLWTFFFPAPERAIRKRLGELEKIATFDMREAPLAKLANARKFSGFFTSDVRILVDLPQQQGMLVGREDLFQRALFVRNGLQGLIVKLHDINVGVASGNQSATVNLTATARIPGERDFMVQEMELAMIRQDGDWLIRQVKTVRTLQ